MLVLIRLDLVDFAVNLKVHLQLLSHRKQARTVYYLIFHEISWSTLIYPELPSTYVLRGLIYNKEDKRVPDLWESLLIYCPADERQQPRTFGIE